MPGRNQRNPAREQYWRSLLAKYEASGLASKSAFCKVEGIKLSSFCAWVNELARRDSELENKSERQRNAERKRQWRIRKQSDSESARQKFWRKALARFKTSGLSEAQFCQQEGYHAPTFVHWKHLLEGQDSEVAVAMQVEHQLFVPVNVPENKNHSSNSQCKAVAEIVFANASIRLFESIDLETAKILLRAISEVTL
jgi:hypothetical protein